MTRIRYRAGARVRFTGPAILGPPTGTTGTVGLVATGRGKSTCPDPCGLMTFVNWDERAPEGVYTRHLEPLKD